MNFFQRILSLFRKPKQEQPQDVVIQPAPRIIYVAPPQPAIAPPVVTLPETPPPVLPVTPPHPAIVPPLPTPFGTDNYGTPFQSQEQADAWKAALAIHDANIAQQPGLLQAERYNGPVPVASLTDAEKAFLTYVTSSYRWDPTIVGWQGAAWYAILNGSLAEVNLAINQGDALAGHGGYSPEMYPADGRMRVFVDQVAQGVLKPVVTH